jgi:hypothetical protein
MTFETIPPVFGWIILVAVLVLPTLYRILRRAYRHWRIRRHMKTIPGPLLGVIYPEMKKK